MNIDHLIELGLLGGAVVLIWIIAFSATPQHDRPFGYYLGLEDAFVEGQIEMEQSDGAHCVRIRKIAEDNYQLSRC